MATLINIQTQSQCATIQRYLERGYRINTKKARRLCQCERLAARISDLKEKGLEIDGVMVSYINSVGQKIRYKEYFLKPKLAA
jgi:hypothetical protein